MRPFLPRLGLSSVLFAFAASAPAQTDKPTKAEIAKRGKAATALVEVKGRGTGTAFCVHSSGLFVTNEHVVRGAEAATLVLNSGLKEQRVFPAKVVRTDKDRDLALLRADAAGEVPALPLGSVDGLTELAELVAVGFPFGRALALDAKEYPTVSVNAGSVTSLRRKAGELDLIQLDVALTYGNSGGPVLDDRGRVVGVVRGGVPGTGVNLAVPVTHLSKLLAAPDVTLVPPDLTADTLDKPAQFKARVAVLMPGVKEPELRLTLQAGEGKARDFPMTKKDGSFVATAVPVSRPRSSEVEITARFGSGMVVGTVRDVELTVGGKPFKLSQVRRIEFKPKPRTVFADGKTAEGAVTGLGAVEITVGGQKVKFDLSAATHVQAQPEPEVTEVTATVVATVDGKELARVVTAVRVRSAGLVPAADPSSIAIAPPALPGDVVVKRMPEPFTDSVLGGGGRYFIFHLPRMKKLAVFDVNEARVTNYIPLSDDRVTFTAGLDKLVVGYPRKGTLERWSLTTIEREVTAFPPFRDEIKVAVMGHGSNGPVVVNGVFLDLATFRPLPLAFPNGGWDPSLRPVPSADGTVYGAWGDTINTFVMAGGEVRRYQESGRGHVVPGPDGGAVFTANGVRSTSLKLSDPEDAKAGYCVPAVRGSYFLADEPGAFAVYLHGHPRPLARVEKAKINMSFHGWDSNHNIWGRMYLVPQANLLVLLPFGNDQLVLVKVDVDAALEQSGVDYLLVTSQPPRSVRPGTTYEYALLVKAKRAPVVFKLDSGPKGMVVSKEGIVRWTVPGSAANEEQDVILTIRDAAGQELIHTFKVRVEK